MIVWARVKHIFTIFEKIGEFEISEINKFVFIPQMGEGGSIIKETSKTLLLNNGLVVLRGPTNDTSDKNLLDRSEVMNFSRKFVKNSKSNVQLNLLEGKIGLELLRSNKLLSAVAGSICKTNAKMRRFQSILLEHFPDAATNFLFGKTERLVEMVGDAIITKRCLKITQYNISWSKMKNDTCYYDFPVFSHQIGEAFMELRSRRILRSSHKVPCNERLTTIYVSDKRDTFWAISLNGTKVQIPHVIRSDSEEGLVLPLLAEFNFGMIHLKTPKPGRESLMELLASQTENLNDLYNFREVGEGSLGGGLTTIIAETIESATDAGTSLISSIVKGTNSLMETTATSISEILGGLPNLVLFALNIAIVGYLIFQRWEMM